MQLNQLRRREFITLLGESMKYKSITMASFLVGLATAA